jgi:hypothetical protein
MRIVLALAAASLCAAAQDAPYLTEPGWRPLISTGSMAGWRTQDGSAMAWRAVRGVLYDAAGRQKELGATAGVGDRLFNAPAGKVANLVSEAQFGDVELYVEYMIPQGSNSGVYLQGLYEVQVFDNWGSKEAPKTSDGGAIYHRWIDGKPVGGSAPRANAALPPGAWQSFLIRFRAPRFDGAGKKTENARFLAVWHNNVLVQENVEVEGGTRSHMPIAEAARNPLMLQGDHGPVAYRNIYVKEASRP